MTDHSSPITHAQKRGPPRGGPLRLKRLCYRLEDELEGDLVRTGVDEARVALHLAERVRLDAADGVRELGDRVLVGRLGVGDAERVLVGADDVADLLVED